MDTDLERIFPQISQINADLFGGACRLTIAERIYRWDGPAGWLCEGWMGSVDDYGRRLWGNDLGGA